MNIFKQWINICIIVSSGKTYNFSHLRWRRERRNGFWLVMEAVVVVRLCQTYTHKSQSILIHIARRPPRLLESSGNHFSFSLSLSLQVAAVEASCSLKNSFSPVDQTAFSFTYLHHLCVNRPFLIRRYTHSCCGIVVSLLFLFALCLSCAVRELI